MTQPATTVTMLSTNDAGQRDADACTLIVIHTFECSRETTAESMAAYQLGDTPEHQTGSYNIVVDGAGRSCRENDDDYRPWAAGPTANDAGLHLSFAGRAADSREVWLGHDAQLREGARIVREWCRVHDIRMDRTTDPAGLGGICGHADTSRAWGETDHTDPGPNFPWDHFLDLVRGVGPAPSPAPTCLGSAS